ncbi:hypothetical protein [Sphingobium yanoikuyae]|uniref:hypothetical protein n=1 Tax=Sphingobium yanoikuyae TaxID=13690 RepID=UPI002431F1A9|nr:hypothetical protein [Sphingobium yanoikuyae]
MTVETSKPVSRMFMMVSPWWDAALAVPVGAINMSKAQFLKLAFSACGIAYADQAKSAGYCATAATGAVTL